MNMYYLTFRSATTAQRGEKLLRKNGIRCLLQRTPRWMEEKGCGYALRIRTERIGESARLLQQGGIGFRKAYRIGSGEEAEELGL